MMALFGGNPIGGGNLNGSGNPAGIGQNPNPSQSMNPIGALLSMPFALLSSLIGTVLGPIFRM